MQDKHIACTFTLTAHITASSEEELSEGQRVLCQHSWTELVHSGFLLSGHYQERKDLSMSGDGPSFTEHPGSIAGVLE